MKLYSALFIGTTFVSTLGFSNDGFAQRPCVRSEGDAMDSCGRQVPESERFWTKRPRSSSLSSGEYDATAASDREIVELCIQRHGFEKSTLDCTAHYIAQRQAGPQGRIALDCTQQHGPGRRAIDCILERQAPDEARLVIQCARENGGFNQNTGTCIAFKTILKQVNPEGRMVSQCVAQYGISKVAVACAATRLTVAEFEKCKVGIGSESGCFGPNNTLRRHIADSYEAARREPGAVAGAIRFGTGVSVEDIRNHGPLGGGNSDARNACNAITGIFGGHCN